MRQVWREKRKSASGRGFIDHRVCHSVQQLYGNIHIIWTIWYIKYTVNFAHNTLKGTSLKDFIRFRHGLSCHSLAGREGHEQDIVLAPFCAEEHTLVHEVTFVHKESQYSGWPKKWRIFEVFSKFLKDMIKFICLDEIYKRWNAKVSHLVSDSGALEDLWEFNWAHNASFFDQLLYLNT